jgi:hypothetical protein
MKQQFLKAKTDTIKLTTFQDNRPIIPTSAKITLYKPGSDTELQAQASASVDATTGEMTYGITAAHTVDNDLNYKAIWEYVVSGVTYYETQLFDVVLSRLSIPITDDDLYNELSSLRKVNEQEKGTATSGAAGSLTDTNRKEEDDFWKGGVIEILAGTGVGQFRDITDFVSSTGVFSITPNWGTNPDTTSKYRVVRSFTKKISDSFEKLETMLYDKGKRHELILESSQVKIPLIYLTIHHISLDKMDEADDKWSKLAEAYWKKFKDTFDGMRLEYDEDESGNIGGEEQGQRPGQITIGRG